MTAALIAAFRGDEEVAGRVKKQALGKCAGVGDESVDHGFGLAESCGGESEYCCEDEGESEARRLGMVHGIAPSILDSTWRAEILGENYIGGRVCGKMKNFAPRGER